MDVASFITGMLELISTDVRAAVLGADQFQASHGVVITWYMVTFAGAGCSSAGFYDSCKVHISRAPLQVT